MIGISGINSRNYLNMTIISLQSSINNAGINTIYSIDNTYRLLASLV